MVEFNVFNLFSFSLGGLHFHFGSKKSEKEQLTRRELPSQHPPVLLEQRPTMRVDREIPPSFPDTRSAASRDARNRNDGNSTSLATSALRGGRTK